MSAAGPGRSAQEAVAVTRVLEGAPTPGEDWVAREQALQLLVNGQPLAIMLRTPGWDAQLALGLLHAEGLLRRREELRGLRLAPSGQLHPELLPVAVRLEPEAENLVDVELTQELPGGALGWQRALPSSSACGICGTATLEALQAFQAEVQGSHPWELATLLGLPERLLQAQRIFQSTGGLHAAGLLAPDGGELEVAEDVGRHNAVDKLVGQALLQDRLPLRDHCLVVSGRAGFEIVQKAAAAGICVLASISAPSSLAVQAAQATGLTLVGFLRGQRCTVYSHPDRLALPGRARAEAVP
ncbi:MAG: formate dehydrogenase accessory sulfurtransferase FdhD [Candidatus Dormibacteria bacterium]